MPWVPQTDFEEEVVNLQPHNDFIFGVLSDPEYSYPRPKAHTEYAANKKIQSKQQQEEYETTGKINAKLHLIQQVQRMASTKPVGEQPTLDDWEDNTKIEQETIGMMRYCGMGVSVEQPFNEKVTIATYPVENTIKIVKNGRRKVALFFDDKVFKLQEKVSDTSSSGFESCNNSATNKFDNIKTDSLASDSEGDTSLNTTSSLLLNSFGTVEECNASFSSASSCTKASSTCFKEERRQYEKLLEDTSLLSLNSSSCSSSKKEKSDTFVTADTSFWTPVFEDEDIFSKKENWPSLSKDNSACNTSFLESNDVLNKTQSTTDDDSEDHNSKKHVSRVSFLNRFIKSDDADTTSSTTKSTSSTPPSEPTSYAAIAKTRKDKPKSSSKNKETKDTSSNEITDFPPFYTTRRMYALKRNAK